MFIQIIQGKCRDAEGMRRLSEEWRRDMAPKVEGWLGSTYGITDDDEFVAVVRFESREAAMRNSMRPEQGQWWKRMEECFDGPAVFHDCDNAMMFLGGGSDDAGFVQIIRGKVEDPSRIKAMLADTSMLHEMRPEIIGGTLALEPDGTFTETVAFRDEDSARAGEQMEPPAEVRSELESMMAGARFYDLHHPWFESA